MERFETSVRFHSWYEHWHRYHFIAGLIKGKNVCDVACGEGYGSALMASSAKTVIGVDLDIETIDNASKKNTGIDNLSFIQSNALNLEFEDNEIDVIVSFETLEHLTDHDELLTEFIRILKNDGLLIISTPDKDIYSAKDDHNEFHIKELTANEFDHLITTKFKFHSTYGQQFQLSSVIEKRAQADLTGSNQHIYVQEGTEQQTVGNNSKPEYLIKICSNNQQVIDDLSLPIRHSFSEYNNRLLQHYDDQIKRLIQNDKQNNKLIETIEKQNAIINHLKARLGY